MKELGTRNARTGNPRARRFVTSTLLLGATVALGASAGCILLTNSGTTQCQSDKDCENLGFHGATCSADKVCVANDTDGGGGNGGGSSGCTSNKQCLDDNGQLPYICKSPGQPCTALLSKDCSKIIGNQKSLADDNVIILGHLTGYTGPEKDYANLTADGMQLATEEIATNAVGLPVLSDGQRHPLVFLSCDSTANYLRAAKHLVEDVGVPAIIGPTDTSDQALSVAVKLAIPDDVMLMQPWSGSPQLETLQDNGLVWQINNSQTDDAVMFKDFVPYLENEIRTYESVTGQIRVAQVVRNQIEDEAVADLYDMIGVYNSGQTIAMNMDAGNFLRIDFDPTNVDWGSVVNQLLTFKPNIIIFEGRDVDYVPGFLGAYEPNRPPGDYNPYYVITVEAKGDRLGNYLHAHRNDMPNLAFHIFGTWSTLPADQSNYNSFRIRYNARFNTDSPGFYNAPAGYDAVYLLAYAMMGAGHVPKLTGGAIASGMASLVGPGATINVGPTSINSALSALAAGTKIDFEGTLSSYQYDLSTGVAPRRSVIFCEFDTPFEPDSGLFYDPDTGQFGGSLLSCDHWAPP